jgi:hypothetical protein
MTHIHLITKALLVLAALTLPHGASAQYLPILPIVRPAFDLDNSRVGSWAEYRTSDGAVSSTQRHALVGEGAQGYLLEVRVESPVFYEPVVFRFAVPGSRKGTPQRFIDVMIGKNPPMRLDTTAPPAFEGFLAESARLGNETIKTPARTFTASHYRHQIEGDTWDYWVSREAPPLGFVRSIKKLGASWSQMELSNVGIGARPTIIAEPRPVDQAEFVRAMANNLRRGK